MIGKSKKTDPLIDEMMSLADEYQQMKREQLILKSEIDRNNMDTVVLSAIEEETILTEDAFGNRTHVKKSIYHQWELAQSLITREIINPEKENDEEKSTFNPSNTDVINKAHQNTLEIFESVIAMKTEESNIPEAQTEAEADQRNTSDEAEETKPEIEQSEDENLSEGFSIVVEEEEYKPEPTRIQEQTPDEFCYQINYEFQFGEDVMSELCYIKNAADEMDAREYFEKICSAKNIKMKAITNVSKLNVHSTFPNVTIYTKEQEDEKQEESPKKASFFKNLTARKNKAASTAPVAEPEKQKEETSDEGPAQELETANQASEPVSEPEPMQEDIPVEAEERPEQQSGKSQKKNVSYNLINFFSRKEDAKEEVTENEPVSEPEEKLEEDASDPCRNDTEYINGVKIGSTQILGDTSGIEVRSAEEPVLYCLTNLNTEVSTIIDKSPFLIGCKQGVCDLVILQDPKVHTVSRTHAQIRIVNGKPIIIDKSVNGTFIGKPGMPDIEFTRLIKDAEQLLKPGQIVRFADRSYLFDVAKEER